MPMRFSRSIIREANTAQTGAGGWQQHWPDQACQQASNACCVCRVACHYERSGVTRDCMFFLLPTNTTKAPMQCKTHLVPKASYSRTRRNETSFFTMLSSCSFEGLPHCVLSVLSVRSLSAKSMSKIGHGLLDEVF